MRIGDRVVDIVSRLPARVQTKLLVAFLAMAALLMLMGAVGLQAIHGVNRQTEELIRLQRKIAAFRQVQHDTTAQLYGVTSALLAPDEQVLQATLRQLTQLSKATERCPAAIRIDDQGGGDVAATRPEHEHLARRPVGRAEQPSHAHD